MTKFSGLSLSFCVKDIMEGLIEPRHIIAIHCSFIWKGKAPERYFEGYWSKWDREEVEKVINQLTIYSGSHNIARGHWMEGEATEERLNDSKDRIEGYKFGEQVMDEVAKDPDTPRYRITNKDGVTKDYYLYGGRYVSTQAWTGVVPLDAPEIIKVEKL